MSASAPSPASAGPVSGFALYSPVDLAPLTREAYAAACREVLRGLELRNLRWRHHALGMLQAEVSPEIRVHVWSPRLRAFPEGGLRGVHDHRFTLLSYVAVGAVTDVPYSVAEESAWRAEDPALPVVGLHEIVHAKAQGEAPGPLSRFLSRVRVVRHEPRTYRAGSVYAVLRRCFHASAVSDLAVTVVHRSDFDAAPARVLADTPVVESGILPQTPETRALHFELITDAQIELRRTLA